MHIRGGRRKEEELILCIYFYIAPGGVFYSCNSCIKLF